MIENEKSTPELRRCDYDAVTMIVRVRTLALDAPETETYRYRDAGIIITVARDGDEIVVFIRIRVKEILAFLEL